MNGEQGENAVNILNHCFGNFLADTLFASMCLLKTTENV